MAHGEKRAAFEKKRDPADHYFEVELTPRQRDALLAVVRRGPHFEGLGRVESDELREALKSPRRVEGTLFREKLPWDDLEAEAERQGCSVVDVFFDRAGRAA